MVKRVMYAPYFASNNRSSFAKSSLTIADNTILIEKGCKGAECRGFNRFEDLDTGSIIKLSRIE